MKKIIVFGMNHFSEMMICYLTADGFDVEAVCADKKYCKDTVYMSKPVIPFENVEKYYPPDKYAFILCLGYKNMNKLRMEKFYQIKEKGYSVLNYIHPAAIVQTKSIGEGNIVLESAVVGFKVTLGDGNIIYPKAQIAHHTSVGDFNFFAVSCSVAGSVKVGNRCFIGNNASTKNGISVKDATLVGAGTYLHCDSEENGVYVPMRCIKLENKKSEDLL